MTSTLSDIAHKIPDFYVLKIDGIANELVQEGKDVIKLNLGKSELPMPRYVADEMINKINDVERREIIDPQGLLALREEIAHHYKAAYGVTIPPEQVFINNGTSPFFLSLFLLLLNPGDEILLPRPYYPTYVANANIARINKKFYQIRDGRIDLDEFRNAFTPGRTKVVLLNSPGNPFGNVHTKRELEKILSIIDSEAYIISDEIYDGFVYNNNFTSIVSVSDPMLDKVVVINGFSKIHHMYTRRLGYAIVPQSLISALLKFQQHNLVCVDPVTQFAGLISLKHRERLIKEEIKNEVEEYENRLHTCEKLIEKTKLQLIKPEGSFYMCVDVSHYLGDKTQNSLALAEHLLRKTEVAVTPGEDFGRDDFFRISLTNRRVVEGISRMCKFFQ